MDEYRSSRSDGEMTSDGAPPPPCRQTDERGRVPRGCVMLARMAVRSRNFWGEIPRNFRRRSQRPPRICVERTLESEGAPFFHYAFECHEFPVWV